MIATCPEQELLRRYAGGMVSEGQADELTSHLRDCPSCQSWLAEAKDLDDTLVASLRHSTVDASFELEPQCQSAMVIALGALAAANQADAEDLIDLPSAIGDYQIVRSIGRGGMGNVYLAQHTKLDRTVAVKVLASHRLSDPRMHDRFEKEMRAIGSLSHPNIVTAHDARDVDGVALLVTEWIDGLDLKDILGRMGPLSVADVCEIGARVAGALSYISAQNQVHRDLKPSNVMINRDGEVKLLDLGLARLRSSDAEHDVSAATATGQALGTADYVAPEQINDAREVDIRADIYGLGCTLYKLLSGRAPFEGDRYTTVFAKLTAHVSEQPAPLRSVAPHVPPAVASLIDQMLAKSPDDRPACPDKFAATLQKHAGEADLQSLVRKAMESDSHANQPEIVKVGHPVSKSIWNRRVPMVVAIACGMVGMILGWFAGILITIKYPDGTVATVHAPAGSEISISEEETPPTQQPDPNPNDDVATEIPSFDGVWKAISIETHDGSPARSMKIENTAIVIHGDEYVFFDKSRPVVSGTYKATDPNLFDLIYSIQGHPVSNKGRYATDPDGSLSLLFMAPVFPHLSEQVEKRQLYSLRFVRVLEPEKFKAGVPFFKITTIPELRLPAYAYQQLVEGVPSTDIALSPPADESRFEGIWVAKSGMHRGKNAPIPSVENVAIVFHGSEFIVMRRSRPIMGGTFELDSDLTQISLNEVENGKTSTYKGLYRFGSDGQLELFLQSPDQTDFPIAFEVSTSAISTSTIALSKVDLPPLSDPAATAAFLKENTDQDLRYWISMQSQIRSGVPVVSLMKNTLAVNKALNETQSKNNLKQLGLAFHAYHDKHNALPMSKGSPRNRELRGDEQPCSWRVAILPYIGQQQLYDQYKLDQPWDSEENVRLLGKMPEIYRRPSDPAGSTVTGYVGFAGENTILGDRKPTNMRDTIDGTSNTVMLVEAETRIPWTKPEDFLLDDLASTGLLDKENLLVLLADGSVAEMKPVTAEWIKGVATTNDGKYFKDLPANVNKW